MQEDHLLKFYVPARLNKSVDYVALTGRKATTSLLD
jgi:hypothetical protein